MIHPWLLIVWSISNRTEGEHQALLAAVQVGLKAQEREMQRADPQKELHEAEGRKIIGGHAGTKTGALLML